MSKSVERRLAIQRGKNLPGGQNPPPLPRHEAVDLALRQHAQRLELAYLDFCVLAEECIREKFYERFGFEDAEPYFQERVGISYRTLRRRLSILEGLNKLPEKDRAEARTILASLGAHKASALAPVLGREGEDWRKWAAFAEKATEEGVQAAVSDLTGALRRGKDSADPGERFYAFLLSYVPPDAIEEVEEVFALGKKLGMTNAMGIFLLMIREVKVEWSNAVESRLRGNTQ